MMELLSSFVVGSDARRVLLSNQLALCRHSNALQLVMQSSHALHTWAHELRELQVCLAWRNSLQHEMHISCHHPANKGWQCLLL